MPFLLTPEEAQSTAQAVQRVLVARGMKVSIEAEISSDVSFRPTLVAEKDDLRVFVEAQGAPEFTEGVAEVVTWAQSERCYCEIHLATSTAAHLSGVLLTRLHRNGVGLMLVDSDGNLTQHSAAKNPALTVALTPGLSLGRCRSEVEEAIETFNAGTRKGGLQDMCELVERETEKLLVAAASNGRIGKTKAQIERMDWSDQINFISADTADTTGTALVSSSLKDDLHSFRNARNLFDHKVRTKRERMQRERQYAERIVQGPRLVVDLLALQRRAKRK